MLKLIDIGYSVGERVLFSRVNLNINKFDRFGLVGANGTGKTTLLRIISQEISATKGNVAKSKNFRIGSLPQEEIVLRGKTLLEEVLKDFHSHLDTLSELGESIEESPHSKEKLDEYARAEDKFHSFGGYDYEAEAYKVVHGLGFIDDDYNKPVEEFSSGWQMRIVLARLLLNRPDLLLLDEPTNHLDIESIEWLEDYLDNFKGAIVIVSHDRYFLDRVLKTPKGTTGIYEIDFGETRYYRTNYTGYLRESRIRKQRIIQHAKTQQRRIREIEDFIARNRANKAKAKLVKSREKYLERMELVQVESERKKIRVSFPVEPIHSQRIIELRDIGMVYNNKEILTNINISIEKGDRIALIGKNGAGKSTLCRIITGDEKPTYGTKKSSEKIEIGAFSHEILLRLIPSNTVLEEAAKDASAEVNRNLRGFLGLFLFSGSDVEKTIDVLSGGEKTRLVVLKAMIKPSNLLILDEPTYHLDRDSVDAVKQAILAYGGTTILVSHNRDLIASFATRVIELRDGCLYDYPGDYQYYLWKKGKKQPQVQNKQSTKKTKQSPQERLRLQIIDKEARRHKLRESFSRPGLINNPRKSKKLFDEYQRLADEIEELENQLTSDMEK
ncbi:MAG: ABC-F family ATP-binding cassette domain-containing protein [bacterium]